MPASKANQRAMLLLIGSALATVGLWQLPQGNFILYPFTILATWFHELAHGLTALLVGGQFHFLDLYPNGSGVASYTIPSRLGDWAPALIAAGGPMGPPVAGAIFILAGRSAKAARVGLFLLALALLLSLALWVRAPFGMGAVLLLALAIWATAWLVPATGRQFAIQFLGVQACVSTYQQVDYLFTRNATIGGQTMVSDTGQIAQHLFFPHWFWAVVIIIFSVLLLLGSLRLAYR